MKSVENLLLFIFLVSFGACLEDDLLSNDDMTPSTITEQKTYANVDRALWSHFAAFEEAARLRGYNIDLERANITGTIMELEGNNIAGTCSYGGFRRDRDVSIDASFWNRANHLYREYIVFHELGHCYLFRDHHEECFNNQTYVSIMRSGNGNCRDNYRQSTREYYVDELFSVLEQP